MAQQETFRILAPLFLIGEASNWQGCLVQFDGSAHKRSQTGGAGVSLLHVTQEIATLARWKSIPLVPCADNVVGEASACLAAVRLAIEYHSQCLARGIPQKGIVIQGDILPLLNYLQGKGRVKRPEVVRLSVSPCTRPLYISIGVSATRMQ